MHSERKMRDFLTLVSSQIRALKHFFLLGKYSESLQKEQDTFPFIQITRGSVY